MSTPSTDYVYVSGELFGSGAYDIYSYFPGDEIAPGAEDVIEIVRNLTVDGGDPGRARVDTPPLDDDAVFAIKRNDVFVAEVRFTPNSVGGTISFASGFDTLQLSSGDTLRVVAPSPIPAEIENVRIVLKTQ